MNWKLKESTKNQKKRISDILNILKKEYPDVKIQLNFENHFELLVATILSAQCTDARVNMVTEKLFKKYNQPEDYIEVSEEELEKDIFSTGYYKAKARHIKAAAKTIINDYGGNVPSNMEDLLKIPGVGRKTANVLLGHCFNTPGIVVDTHVIRIANRLGFINTKDPYKIEKKLNDLIQKDEWVSFTHYFINHGRKICTSRKAKCSECVISNLCPSAQ